MERFFYYAFVADKDKILAEHAANHTNYRDKALEILRNKESGQDTIIVDQKPVTYYSISSSKGLSFLSVCIINIRKDVQLKFLNEVKTRWEQTMERNFFIKLFLKKVDFNIELENIITRYNKEISESIENFINNSSSDLNKIPEEAENLKKIINT